MIEKLPNIHYTEAKKKSYHMTFGELRPGDVFVWGHEDLKEVNALSVREFKIKTAYSEMHTQAMFLEGSFCDGYTLNQARKVTLVTVRATFTLEEK